MKRAFITGITGQDGAYLAELLLEKQYEVFGLVRRLSYPNHARIEHIKQHPRLHLCYGDMTDSLGLVRLLAETMPHEVYHLAAQSHVGTSFETPEYTAQVDGLGTLRILEALRLAGLTTMTKFYQASTSELFGKVQQIPQIETTPFYPRSPYAAAKLYAYWITVNYREAYNMFAVNGILFNHESPLRGDDFVTQKIVKGLVAYTHKGAGPLFLGNLDAQRDWGYAPDYVRAMWLMLQHETPEDFVIATGKTHTIRACVDRVATELNLSLVWHGEGKDAYACDVKTGKKVVMVDPKLFRPTEVDLLLGDASKALKLLGWEPSVSFEELISRMVQAEIERASFVLSAVAKNIHASL